LTPFFTGVMNYSIDQVTLFTLNCIDGCSTQCAVGDLTMTKFTEEETHRIIEMAWEDRTTFEAIEENYTLSEKEVIKLMRKTLKPRSFKVWRARVSGRKTKNLALRGVSITRMVCTTQYKHK